MLPTVVGINWRALQERLSSDRVGISQTAKGNSPMWLFDKFKLFSFMNLQDKCMKVFNVKLYQQVGIKRTAQRVKQKYDH